MRVVCDDSVLSLYKRNLLNENGFIVLMNAADCG